MIGNQTLLTDPKLADDSDEAKKKFSFDYSYWSFDERDSHYASQERVFGDLGAEVVKATFEGYNSCVFAYGQTGSGKSYTMSGYGDAVGLIPRICEALLGRAIDGAAEAKYRATVSYLEIYNEQVRDLLAPDRSSTALRCREHPKLGPFVEGLSSHDVTTFPQIEALMAQGNSHRVVAATKMNDTSSRSHAVFTLLFTQAAVVDGVPTEKVSRLNLVDLAGSERSSATGATGLRLQEGGNINKSLTTLGLVISALAERSGAKGKKDGHIPFRDSVLTFLLKDSLGGNSRTIMVAAISPADINYGETLSTLHYANRAKNIINKAVVNEDPNVRIIRELRAEIEQLKVLLGGDTTIARLRAEAALARETLAAAETPEDKANAQAALERAEDALAAAPAPPPVELLQRIQASEAIMSKLTSTWQSKWEDSKQIFESRSLALKEHGRGLTLEPEQGPHLVLVDSIDALAPGIVLYTLTPGPTVLGRSDAEPAPDIALVADTLAAAHCTLVWEDDVIRLLPGEGRTLVDDTEVSEPVELHQGQIINLDDCYLFKFINPAEVSRLKRLRESGTLPPTPSRTTLRRLASPAASPQRPSEALLTSHLSSPLTSHSSLAAALPAVEEKAAEEMTLEGEAGSKAEAHQEATAASDTHDHDHRDRDLEGDVSEEEVLDVGPATVIVDDDVAGAFGPTAEDVLFAQASEEKALLATRIAELEALVKSRDEQHAHEEELVARLARERDEERQRQAEKEGLLAAEQQEMARALAAEREAVARLQAEHAAALQTMADRMRAAEASLEERARAAAQAEQRVQDEVRARAEMEQRVAAAEQAHRAEREEERKRTEEIARVAEEERRSREEEKRRNAELTAANDQSRRQLEEQQRLREEEVKRRADLTKRFEISMAERRPPPEWSFTVPRVTTRHGPSGMYEAYEVIVKLGPEKWILYRRYREFEWLHKRVRAMMPACTAALRLPTKGFFHLHDDEFIEKRRKELQAYLNDLAAATVANAESPFGPRDRTRLINDLAFFRPGDMPPDA